MVTEDERRASRRLVSKFLQRAEAKYGITVPGFTPEPDPEERLHVGGRRIDVGLLMRGAPHRSARSSARGTKLSHEDRDSFRYFEQFKIQLPEIRRVESQSMLRAFVEDRGGKLRPTSVESLADVILALNYIGMGAGGKKVGRALGCPERTAHNRLEKLVEYGVLEIVEESKRGERNRSHEFTAEWDEHRKSILSGRAAAKVEFSE